MSSHVHVWVVKLLTILGDTPEENMVVRYRACKCGEMKFDG